MYAAKHPLNVFL